MTDAFAQGFASWRRVLAGGGDVKARMVMFINCASEVAGYVAHGLPEVEAADALTELACAHGLELAFGADEVQRVIAEAFETVEVVPPLAVEPQLINGRDRGLVVVATAYVLPDPATLPVRGWIYGRHYIRGATTSTVAPGGFGKTSLALFEALEMVKAGYCVWYVSAEDDRIELDRRIAGYGQRHGLLPAQLLERFFVDDKLSFPFKIARVSGRNGVAFDDERLAAFEAEIARRRIDVVIFDPFISFHYLPENDTASMDALIKRLGDICSRQTMCIELPHHVRKRPTGQGEITVDDARGAGAIVNAVRSCRVINVMSAIEAQQAEVAADKRAFYLRIDSGKSNMAPPEKARWCHLASVEIANGDSIGVIEPWEFPAVFNKVTVADVDWVRELVRVRRYRADSRSSDWLGLELAERFGRNITEQGNIKWINAVLTTWVRNGVIAKAQILDDTRRVRTWYVPVAPVPDLGPTVVAFKRPDEDGDGDF